MKKVISRLVSAVLSCSIFLSLATPSFSINIAEDSENQILKNLDVELENDEHLIFCDTLPDGDIAVGTSYTNPDNSITYTYFENGVPIRIYIVTPGSGYYRVKECVGGSREISNHGIGKLVYVGDPIMSSEVNITKKDDYEYWGTVDFYNPYMDKTYSIECSIQITENEYATFSPLAYYAEKAAFIAGAVAILCAPQKEIIIKGVEKALEKIFQKAVEYKYIVPATVGVSGFIVEEGFSVNAVETTYNIHGVDANGVSEKDFKSSGGYIVTVYDDQGFFSGDVFKDGWTEEDWGDDALGKMMAWAVFGVEYSPISWS